MVDREIAKVKEANKSLYNKVKDDYEKIDGRRSEALLHWLRNKMEGFSKSLGGQTSLLDIGCGSGFVMKAARGLFTKLYGIDISENILRKTSRFSDGVICADADFLPLKDESIDVVVLFATMHHLYDFRITLSEIHRVLKKQGILYIDHDLNKQFADKFKLLIRLYRMASRRKAKYIAAGIEEQIYDLSEFHSDGINKEELELCLIESGFEVLESHNHWFGLSRFTDIIFGRRKYSLAYAPLLCIVAKKV